MKLLLNDKELAYFLISLLDLKTEALEIPIQETNTEQALGWALVRRDKKGQIPGKFAPKVIDKVTAAVRTDLEIWKRSVKDVIKNKQKFLQKIFINKWIILLISLVKIFY